MNAVTETKAAHSTIAKALATAQIKMGKALKSANNPHFKSKYADLASVVDACMPALNEAGIAVIQPTTDDDNGRYVETILIHGESGETLKCRVPLIVSKNDMQGYGSAVTYARRYGLMSMAGIAPEDDDGNAASKAPPPAFDCAAAAKRITGKLKGAESIEDLRERWTSESNTISEIRSINGGTYAALEQVKNDKKAELDAKNDLGGDEIPDFDRTEEQRA